MSRPGAPSPQMQTARPTDHPMLPATGNLETRQSPTCPPAHDPETKQNGWRKANDHGQQSSRPSAGGGVIQGWIQFSRMS